MEQRANPNSESEPTQPRRARPPDGAHPESGRTVPRAAVEPGGGAGTTRPGRTLPHSPASASGTKEAPRFWRSKLWWRWFLAILVYGLAVLGVAGGAGYLSGLGRRESLQTSEQNQALQEQFDLGVQDLLAARYELARQRFDFILGIDPHYPGALELLEKARQALNQPTLTPSPPPTPTSQASPTPTLDLGSLDGLYSTAQSAQVAGNWNLAIEALTALIAEDPAYRRGEVDQLLYSALRNRGLAKIWAGDKEQGIYDLALAERIFALDSQADSWRRSAAYYLFANSYFGLDWALSTQYFAQICQAGIWDGCFKYARSAWEYADQLFKEEDPCAAVQQYEASLLTLHDAARAPTATEAFTVCMTATAPSPSPSPSPTPSLALETATETATMELTSSPTSPGASATFTPTFTPSPPVGPSGTPTPTLTPTATATATS